MTSEMVRARIIIHEYKRIRQFILNADVFYGRWYVQVASGWRIVNENKRAA